ALPQETAGKSGLKVLAVEDTTASTGAHAKVFVTIGAATGQKLLEFLVDANESARAYESKLFDANAGLKKVVTCNEFPDSSTKPSLPRRAEIVEFRNAVESRRDQIGVINASADAAAIDSALNPDALAPSGWTVLHADRDRTNGG